MIVIDGLDGSGKATQAELLKNRLKEKGYEIFSLDLPYYDDPSSTLVKMYLGGEFSKNAEDVNAYASSSFYAVDRYASYKLYWEKDYLDDKLILASRYVSSNAIHQMVKLPEEEWEKYLQWLVGYEHVKMDIPKADKVIFLDMPIEISQKLLSQRYNGDENKKDIHESNIEYLHRCRKSALFAAEKLGWAVVTCSNGENALPTDEISKKIMKIIDEVI